MVRHLILRGWGEMVHAFVNSFYNVKNTILSLNGCGFDKSNFLCVHPTQTTRSVGVYLDFPPLEDGLVVERLREEVPQSSLALPRKVEGEGEHKGFG